MRIPCPPVDGRSYEQVVSDTEALVRAYSGWRPRRDGALDAGGALVRIFAAMARQVLTRFDRVPDRSFLAYLDMIGVELRPPRAARVPLTFTRVPKSAVAARVPRGTRVTAARLPGDTGDVSFETIADLELTDAQLTQVVVHGSSGETDFTGATGPFTVFPAGAFRTDQPDLGLYLGFDGAFGPRSISIYVSVAPLSGPIGADTDDPGAPQVVWEYASRGGAWAPLGAADGTAAFALSGVVTFVGPADQAPDGSGVYWIRARRVAGGYRVAPGVAAVITNTVIATHTTTVTNEILGSSDQTPGQTFRLVRTPVLAGQRIEIREPSMPSSDEIAALGPDAVTVIAGSAGAPDQIWVRWQPVPNFHLSGPRDRHYQFDSATGRVSFGDGRRGRLVPAGVGNVRAAFYQSGGGAAGNRPAKSVCQLKSGIPGVKDVSNHDPASGGADAESLDQLMSRGPTRLRHRGRAVAAEDFEDLAREASPAVARVCAVTPAFDPTEDPTDQTVVHQTPKGVGDVVVVLVPWGTEPQPTPGLGLLQDVEAYLRARCAPAVNLVLSGPTWLTASVTVEIVPTSMVGADTLCETVRAALDAYFHPLTGGFDGAGWQMGQLPHASDVERLVASIEGVDAVASSSLTLPNGFDEQTSDDSLAGTLVCSGSHTVTPSTGA